MDQKSRRFFRHPSLYFFFLALCFSSSSPLFPFFLKGDLPAKRSLFEDSFPQGGRLHSSLVSCCCSLLARCGRGIERLKTHSLFLEKLTMEALDEIVTAVGMFVLPRRLPFSCSFC
jgi:hypothetical protein